MSLPGGDELGSLFPGRFHWVFAQVAGDTSGAPRRRRKVSKLSALLKLLPAIAGP